jgi:hypothetical protein
MPADYPFKNQKLPSAHDINEDDTPLIYDAEDDGRLWQLLSVYADGEATEAEAVEVEALLRSDSVYAQDFRFLRSLTTQAHALPEVEPPSHLRAAILDATTHRPTFARRVLAGLEGLRAVFRSAPRRYVVPAGALAAAALLAFTFWPRSGDHPGFAPVSVQKNLIARNDNKQEARTKPAASGNASTIKGNARSEVRVAVVTPKRKPEAKPVVPAISETERRKQIFIAAATNEIKLNRTQSDEPKKSSVAQSKPKLTGNKSRPNTPSSARVQGPGAADTNPSVAGFSYAPRPMMDKEYQRRLEVAMGTEPGDDSFKVPDIQPDDNLEVRGTGGGATPAVAKNENNEPVSGTRTTVFRSGRPMPAFNRQYVTGADLKRERDAATLGYTRSAVMSIQRSELTGNVVGRF